MDDLIRALPKLLQAAGDADELLEAAAFVAWRKAIGEPMRARAVPLRLHGKTLTISVIDAAWKKQLEALSSQLIFRLNALLGRSVVAFLDFRVDPETGRAERDSFRSARLNPARNHTAALRSVAGKVFAAANAIDDEALRRKFLLAAGACLAKQESAGGAN